MQNTSVLLRESIGKRSFGRERENTTSRCGRKNREGEDGGGKESVKEKTNENDFREVWLPYVDDASRFVKFRMIGQRQVPVPLCSHVQLILISAGLLQFPPNSIPADS